MDRVDLNCDMGEGIGTDDEIMPYITSANIACGFHAGGPATMRATVASARRHGVAIGAHPGLPDRANFGRVAMPITPDDAYDMVVYQVAALEGFVRAEGGDAAMTHVKPHGALYNMAAGHATLADAIARAVRAVNPRLILMGLSGSELIRAGRDAGLVTASEVFGDRSYRADGTLTPRGHSDALITDVASAVQQSVDLVRNASIRTTDGNDVPVLAETICIHGDGEHAVAFARAIRNGLAAAGITVAPLARHS